MKQIKCKECKGTGKGDCEGCLGLGKVMDGDIKGIYKCESCNKKTNAALLVLIWVCPKCKKRIDKEHG